MQMKMPTSHWKVDKLLRRIRGNDPAVKIAHAMNKRRQVTESQFKWSVPGHVSVKEIYICK